GPAHRASRRGRGRRADRTGAAPGRGPWTPGCHTGPVPSRSAWICSARPSPRTGHRRSARPTAPRCWCRAARRGRPPRSQAQVPLRGDLGAEAVQVDEALGVALVERIALVVGGEVEVVQRRVRTTAVDDDLATVEHHADIAGDVLL